MSNSLFRDKALKKITAPEELEKPLRIVGPGYRFVLLALALLVLFAVIWSFAGRLPMSVNANGIVTSQRGLQLVRIPFGGVINEIKVKTGDTVQQGDLIATVEQLDLQFEIRRLQSEFNDLKETYARYSEYADPVSRARRTQELNRSVQAWEDSVRRIEGELSRLGPDEDGLRQSRLDIARQFREEFSWKYTEATNFKVAELLTLKNNMDEIRHLLNQKRSEYQMKTQLVSPYDGVVVELSLGEGDVFEASHPVATLENLQVESTDLEGVLFADAAQAKNIHAGMEVFVHPSTVAVEEYGYLKASVVEVGKYPASRAGLFNLLKNEELIDRLSRNNLPVYVRVKLIPDKQAPSGFAWTSGTGPDFKVLSGTLVDARIILAEKRPVELIFPSVKLSH